MEHLQDHHTHHHEDAVHDHSRDWVKSAILLGLAAYFAFNILSGNLTNYVNFRFAWLSYLAVALFAALGTASVIALLRHDHDHDHDHDDHSHDTISWPVIVVVATPLLLGTLVPSRPLGAEAVGGSISLNAVSAGIATTITDDPLQRNVLDWLRIFTASDLPASFNGEQADVTGFVYREATFPPDTFMVARFTVSCCVADASAIGLPVYIENAGSVAPSGAWVRVQGAFEARQFRDRKTPILVASSIEPIDQPEHPYLYP